MTEREWMTCSEPETMLHFLRGKGSDRKLRLFAVACCRHIWDLLEDERSRLAVETSAAYIEGLASRVELHSSQEQAEAVVEEFWLKIRKVKDNLPNSPAQKATAFTAADPLLAFRVASEASTARVWAGSMVLEEMQAAKITENNFQCHLLRDLFGNPFRPVTIDRRGWAPEVVALAETIYDHHSFDRLPELAQLLQETGCENIDVLNHCRQPGEHARGCWVVDLILGMS